MHFQNYLPFSRQMLFGLTKSYVHCAWLERARGGLRNREGSNLFEHRGESPGKGGCMQGIYTNNPPILVRGGDDPWDQPPKFPIRSKNGMDLTSVSS